MSSRLVIQSQFAPRASNICQAAGGGLHHHWGRVGNTAGTTISVFLDGCPVAKPGLAYSRSYTPNPGDFVAVDHDSVSDAWIVTHAV